MKNCVAFFAALALLLLIACPLWAQTHRIGISGDSSDVTTPTEFGVVLAGGSTDVDEAMKWLIDRTGGGDIVILRASGSTGYNDYLFELGKVNSVETLMIDSREKSMSLDVGKRIREAEGLFIAGGDQWNYVKYWSNSEVSEAIRFLIDRKKVPIGGTSAGCAVLTNIIFDARSGSATADALRDPYDTLVDISESFIDIPWLKNTIADQHYSQRERLGRHIVFMARMISDFKIRLPKGIGVDEKTAVCIDKDGNVRVFGSNNAYFIEALDTPETTRPKTPLTWDRGKKALRVSIIKATPGGAPAFNIRQWPGGKPTEYWSVKNGILVREVAGQN